MPTVHREGGIRFFFFSNEGNEPPHIHVEKGDAYGKLWLQPPTWARAQDFTAAELRFVLHVVRREAERFLEQWHGHFDG